MATKASKKAVKRASKAGKTVKKRMTKHSQKTRKSSPKAVKKVKASSQKPVTKSSKASQFKSPYPRATTNVFRAGSAYGIVYDVLHAHPSGISRQQLVTEVAKITKKDERHASFDCSVLLSAKENGERHQSCRSGFWVERINDHLKLHVTATPTNGK